ncbi:prepilin peptidase [Halovulum sp. GXIMD14793]
MSQGSHDRILPARRELAKLVLHIFVYGALLFLAPPPAAGLLVSTGLAVLLIWISLVDLDCYEIPDVVSALLILTGLVVIAVLGGSVLAHLLGGLVWGGAFAALAWGYHRFRGVEGLGLGDAKLMVGIGIWLGPSAPASVVLGAALSGIGFILLMHRNARDSPIAFGPFLCFFAWVVWLFGPLGI